MTFTTQDMKDKFLTGMILTQNNMHDLVDRVDDTDNDLLDLVAEVSSDLADNYLEHSELQSSIMEDIQPLLGSLADTINDEIQPQIDKMNETRVVSRSRDIIGDHLWITQLAWYNIDTPDMWNFFSQYEPVATITMNVMHHGVHHSCWIDYSGFHWRDKYTHESADPYIMASMGVDAWPVMFDIAGLTWDSNDFECLQYYTGDIARTQITCASAQFSDNNIPHFGTMGNLSVSQDGIEIQGLEGSLKFIGSHNTWNAQDDIKAHITCQFNLLLVDEN